MEEKQKKEKEKEEEEDARVWPAIDAFFSKFGLLSHQKESFNSFFLFSIPEIIHENMPIYFGKGRYAIEV